jgi:UDP-2-acetamido-3-amino-2,3-dideoxy-glucuronate N-acetyltransferase
MMSAFFIHPSSDVQTKTIGERSRIWQFCVVLPHAKIGADCNICANCFIENDVLIGDRVTVKCGVQLWDGITIEDDVFVGPNVTFTNDSFPRSGNHLKEYPKTTIQRGASIGANATILPGLTVGVGSMVGAGSVVTSNVPAGSVVTGNPARVVRYVLPDEFVAKPTNSIHVEKQSTIEGVRWIKLTSATDMRGELIVAQWNKHLHFQPKRVFFVCNVPSTRVRGEHAHKVCEQVVVAIAGSIHVVLDDAKTREEFVLEDNSKALLIPAGIWATQYKYSQDSVLAVFASHDYDEADYLRDYEAFLEYRKR